MRYLSYFLLVAFLGATEGSQAQFGPQPLPDDAYPQEPNPGEPPPPIGAEIPYSLGGGEVPRTGFVTQPFYPRGDLNRIVKVRLIGSANNIDIREFRIVAADGRVRLEQSLLGELPLGAVREIYLDGRSLQRIEVTGTSLNLFKKPGKYRVDVTAVR